MSLPRQRPEQAACSHVRLTYAGSNKWQTRLTCTVCSKTLLLIYHSLPEDILQEALAKRGSFNRGVSSASPWAPDVTAARDQVRERRVSGPPGPDVRARSPSPRTRARDNIWAIANRSEMAAAELRALGIQDGTDEAETALEEMRLRVARRCQASLPGDEPPLDHAAPTAPHLCLQCHLLPSWNGRAEEFCTIRCRDQYYLDHEETVD